MKLLISGATGFVGKNLIDSLLNKNNDVFAIVRPSTNQKKLDKRIKTFTFDGNIENLLSFMQREKFDGVVHLAALVLTTHKTEDIKELIDSNVYFPTSLLEASTKSNVKWFINTGTFWQHYKNKKYSPVDLYAATKQAFEDIARYYIETTKINFVTLKLCDNFGPNDERPKLMNLLLKISKTKETLNMSPGRQIIDINYIDNVVDAYIKLIEILSTDKKCFMSGKSFIVNSDERLTLKKLVNVFEKVNNKKLNINWGGKEYRYREVMTPWNKGKRVPGWKPKTNLKDGIQRILDKNVKI